jgi:ABC-type antimicrobial peptide transport system, permease component
MALFIMILRKMVQNKWLVASLFAGIAISVALVSSIPIYSEAVMSRMIKKDLEQLQLDKNVYPGAYAVRLSFMKETPEQRNEKFNRLEAFMREQGAPGFQLPVRELVTEVGSRMMKIRPEDQPDQPANTLKSVSIKGIAGLEDHITLLDGRMPAAQPVDGVYEVLVTPQALGYVKAVLGKVYTVEDNSVTETIKLKPVGTFEKKEDDDPFFRNASLADLRSGFIIPYELARQQLFEESRLDPAYVSWHTVLEYNVIEMRHVDEYLNNHDAIQKAALRQAPQFQLSFEATALNTISTYGERAQRLSTLIWALNAPVLLMLGFYMFMVSNLIAGRQANEIAVIRSRGAARWQIIASYMVEGALLCGAAFAVGPLLGAMLTEVLGASNGFLEFVQRVRLPVRITVESYQYAAMAAGACLVIVIIPIIMATRVSIVNHKQQMARMGKTPLWHKMFLDVITLALAFYGLYTFNKRMDDLQALGLNTEDLHIDPLQFVVPALFIMGAGLLLLRLYPWVLRLVYFIGRKWWSPSLYATLIQVSRSSSQYQFLMIFLVMTIATGVFSASAARTINDNIEDRIRYANGADVIASANWVNDAPPPSGPGGSGPPGGGSQQEGRPSRVNYLEPPFDPYKELPGVEHAARVFTKSNVGFYVNQKSGQATLIGIDSDEFGMTTWFRDGLLDYSLNEYLNLMAADSNAVLISRTLADQRDVKAGDVIWIGWEDVPQQPFTVFGIIDYFPTFNPNPPTGTVANAKADNAPMLIVGHLPKIQVQLAIEPYDVWLKLEEGAAVGELYEGIEEASLNIHRIVNTRDELIRAKNDPFILALNGVLTLGFVLSILVSFAGFLLYWILTLRGRALQNGILRAIGLSLKNLIAMLVSEQALTSGVGVLLGVLIGNAASRLYVPSLQIAFNPSSLVPPFFVKFESLDFLRIYLLVGIMLAVGLCILAYMLSRLRVHQALKLGED